MSNEKLLINDINSNNFEVKSNNEEKQIEEMAKDLCTLNRECENCPFQLKGIKCNPKRNAERFIAKGYRKQSENVIVLPCKVGQTVYMPWEWKETSGIAILTVERISITEAGKSIRTDLWSDDEDYWLAYNCGVFYFDDIGKIVFITKAEAEQALAKMKGGAE